MKPQKKILFGIFYFVIYVLLFTYFIFLTGSEGLLSGKLLNSEIHVTGHILLSQSAVTVRLRSSSHRLLEQLILLLTTYQF